MQLNKARSGLLTTRLAKPAKKANRLSVRHTKLFSKRSTVDTGKYIVQTGGLHFKYSAEWKSKSPNVGSAPKPAETAWRGCPSLAQVRRLPPVELTDDTAEVSVVKTTCCGRVVAL